MKLVFLNLKNSKTIHIFSQTLNGKNDQTHGGVILFITDGENYCNGRPTLRSPDLKKRIEKTKVRIISVAFSNDADKDLEYIAEISGGKSFLVRDSK